MCLKRVFTIGFGPFSPLREMAVIWDVYFLCSVWDGSYMQMIVTFSP